MLLRPSITAYTAGHCDCFHAAQDSLDQHSTRECVAVQATEGDHTSVLRAPDWDAHLEAIDEQVVRRFEADRRRLGGYLLLIQTPEWEFSTVAYEAGNRTIVGPVGQRSTPMPSTAR